MRFGSLAWDRKASMTKALPFVGLTFLPSLIFGQIKYEVAPGAAEKKTLLLRDFRPIG